MWLDTWRISRWFNKNIREQSQHTICLWIFQPLNWKLSLNLICCYVNIFSAIDSIYTVHTCFLVRVLPVLSLMYLAISSLRPERKITFSVSFTVTKRWRQKQWKRSTHLSTTLADFMRQTTNRKLMKWSFWLYILDLPLNDGEKHASHMTIFKTTAISHLVIKGVSVKTFNKDK